MGKFDEIDDSNLEFYSISDINSYCNETRTLVASDFSGDITDKELDEYISISQVEKFVNEFCDDHDEDGLPIICEESHNEICDAILTRIQNVGLAKLAANGTINVAFDEKLNDFIFWTT